MARDRVLLKEGYRRALSGKVIGRGAPGDASADDDDV
jgi:hypothetical protein